MTIKDVAQETHLDWKTIKELDKQYMGEQLRRIGTPAPKVIGIDEIAIRKGHTYRIVVSDLLRRRPIWFGGQDRSEPSMDEFFKWLGPKKSKQIRLAGRGHVEGFSQIHTQAGARARGCYFVRQVPCPTSFG
jgi:transposase